MINMNLILWRHAIAEEGFNKPDLERKLTPKGHKQAQIMANWLEKHAPSDLRVISSPAKRTIQTVSAFTKNFEIIDSIAPEANPDEILKASDFPNAGGSILVVGHQPTLGALVANLLTATNNKTTFFESWSVKKGSIWWIVNRSREEQSENILKAVISPEHLSRNI